MSYLSVANFWKYQNADIWSKAKTHPPWFKHYVHRDRELDQLDPMARLLFYELLGAATRHRNVLFSDPKWLLTETLLDANDIAKHLPVLLKGGWIKETRRPVRSRKRSRIIRESFSLARAHAREDEDKEEDIPPTPLERGEESLRDQGENPRALGTNPRAKAKREKHRDGLKRFVCQYWDEYPDKSVLMDELRDRGAETGEAGELIEQEKRRRGTP